MKKLVGILFLFSIFSINSYSQVVWERIDIPPSQVFACFEVSLNGDIYIGAYKMLDSGGVYRSEDNGITWEFIGLDYHSIYSLSFNHEGNLLAGVGNGAGIFIYDLEQKTWSKVYESYGNVIVIVPGFNDVIFGGSVGIDRSVDDGYSWEQVFLAEGGSFDFAVLSQDTVFVGRTQFTGTGQSSVYRSTDGGDIWQPNGLQDHKIDALALTNNGDLYAGSMGHYYNGYGGIYKQQQGSDGWDTLLRGPRVRTIVVTEEDNIYCGFVTANEGYGGVLHSKDDGETWLLDTSGMGNIGIKQLLIDNHERLFAISNSNNSSKLFRSISPVSVKQHTASYNREYSYCSPNPFSLSAKIYFDNPSNGPANLHLNIYSFGGKKIITRALSSNEVDQAIILIERNNLAKGMYSYTISGANYYSAGKFVVTN